MRGMAVGEIYPKDFLKIIFKEFQVGILAGFVLGLINFIRLMIMYPNNIFVNLTVVLSVYIIVISSKIIGAVLPILAKACRLDPAIMAAPLITTIIDALGLIVYFNLATHLLGL